VYKCRLARARDTTSQLPLPQHGHQSSFQSEVPVSRPRPRPYAPPGTYGTAAVSGGVPEGGKDMPAGRSPAPYGSTDMIPGALAAEAAPAYQGIGSAGNALAWKPLSDPSRAVAVYSLRPKM